MDPDIVKDMRERQDKMYNLQSSLQNGDFNAYVFPPISNSAYLSLTTLIYLVTHRDTTRFSNY